MTDDVHDRLLQATLPHVAFDGWSERALLAGAADAGVLQVGQDGVARRFDRADHQAREFAIGPMQRGRKRGHRPPARRPSRSGESK